MDSFFCVDGIRCIKIRIMYILSFYNKIYTGILRTLEILYMCARVFTFKTQQNNKKSFLLNDLHLRNRDKPLTILFLCYNFGFFIYLVKANCHVVVCELFLLFLFFRLSLSDEKGRIYMSIELYCNDLILLKTRRFLSKLISLYVKSTFIRKNIRLRILKN